MRDVFRADRLLGQPSDEGAAHRGVAIGGQQRVQPVDIANPNPRAPMGQLGEVFQGRPDQGKQVLALQVAFGALAGHRGHVLGPMLGERRLRAPLPLAFVHGFEAASDDPDARDREKSVPGMPIASGAIEYECVSSSTSAVGHTGTRKARCRAGTGDMDRARSRDTGRRV